MLRQVSFLAVLMGLMFTPNLCLSQSQLVSSELDSLDQLIKYKHELEANHELKSTYKLQLFSGSLEEANDIIEEFKSLNLKVDSKIVYQTPNYKVWVGNFRNRIQADRLFDLLKSKYPNTLIIRPGK